MMHCSHIGVVVPVYNEADCLPLLRQRLSRVLEDIDCRYDVYLIDDGSNDESAEIIRRIAAEDPHWHGVFLARNFGHQAAITAGMNLAAGDVIVVMDADLQDEPEAIPTLLKKWREGYDVVYAIRAKRKENLPRRFAYWLFYRVLHWLSQGRVPMDTGDFCLMGRRVADAIISLPENNRFVRGLRAWVGFRQTGVTIERGARAAGKPQYTIAGLIKLATDGIIDFSLIPLRLASLAGLVSIVGALTYITCVLVLKLLGRIELQGWTTVVFLVSWFGGMILMSLGVMGEYIGRIYIQAKRRPMHIVAGTTKHLTLRNHVRADPPHQILRGKVESTEELVRHGDAPRSSFVHQSVHTIPTESPTTAAGRR